MQKTIRDKQELAYCAIDDAMYVYLYYHAK